VRMEFRLEDNVSTTREQVKHLLDCDRFMCGTGTNGGNEPAVEDRWTSRSLVRLISRVFFIKAESGVARHAATRSYFDPLRAETIYYIVTCLCWCLKEYETGIRIKRDADAEFEELYCRFEKSWNLQDKFKCSLIRVSLTGRVKDHIAQLDGDMEEKKIEQDPHKDDLSSLEAYKQYLPKDMQDKLAELLSHRETHEDEDVPILTELAPGMKRVNTSSGDGAF